MGKKQRTLRSRIGLQWCTCVGHLLAHRDCRIYTNRRWGVKVTTHVRTLCRRDLTVPEPWMALESTAKGLSHYFGRDADRVVRRNWRTLRNYREAQARVAEAMKKIYTPKFIARVKGTGAPKTMKLRRMICWIRGHQRVPPHPRTVSDLIRIVRRRAEEQRYEPGENLPTHYCRRCLLELD